MWIYVSTRLMGEVERVDDTAVVTRMACVYFMPLAPEGSYVVTTPAGSTQPTYVPIPMMARSVVASYLSHWGVVAGVAAIVGALALFIEGRGLAGGMTLALAAALSGGSRLAVRRLSTLGGDEREKRRVYATWIGPAIDPCLCGSALDPWVDGLRGLVAGGARGAPTRGYRSMPQGNTACVEAALASEDVGLLGASFTLVRAEMARTADRRELAKLADLHGRLWALISPRLEQVLAVDGVAELARAEPLPGRATVPRRSRVTAARVALLGASAAVLAVAAVLGYGYAHPALYAVDLSDRRDLVFTVDGERLEKSVAPGVSAWETGLWWGEHEIVATQRGEVVDRTHVTMSAGDSGVVYAPAARSDACLVFFEVIYGGDAGRADPPRADLLDPRASLWKVPVKIDYVLSEPPRSITVSNHQSYAEHRWGLVAKKCPQKPPESDP